MDEYIVIMEYKTEALKPIYLAKNEVKAWAPLNHLQIL
jgi:hypothetical protein